MNRMLLRQTRHRRWAGASRAPRNGMRVSGRALALVWCTLLVAPAVVLAQANDLIRVSIEDLMNIEITSAARKEQQSANVPAAVFVIGHDDIRRSGMTTIPDLLRLAPGVDVAQINGNKWAVSIRGFNNLFANKLLILIDGRSIYTRLFSGVVWDYQDLMVDEIDRIEVIRGPSAAMWGANAMNGVINIVTKSTADTQGALVRAEAGRSLAQGAVRYGGVAGKTSYRVFSQWTRRNESLLATGADANDGSYNVTNGFRLERGNRPAGLLLEGGLTVGQAYALWPNFDPATAAGQPIADGASELKSGHVLVRSTRTRASGATLQVQSFVDISLYRETLGRYQRQLVDLDTQYRTAVGARHDLVAGVGLRFTRDRFDGNVGIALTPADDRSSLVTAFVADEIALAGGRLAATVGTQAQYDSKLGAGVQPTARAIWTALPRQRLWTAVSGAMRTPSLAERGLRMDLPPVPSAGGLPLHVSLQGNPDLQTERFVDLEAGYRLEVGSVASVDVTAFAGRYNRLRSDEVESPSVQLVPAPHILVVTRFDNQLEASTRGIEIAGLWAPRPALRLEGSYTGFHFTPRLAATSRDPNSASLDANAPRHKWQMRSTFALGPRASVGLAIHHIGRLEQTGVDAYTRADLTVGWQFSNRLSVMGLGQNIFTPAHAEFSTSGGSLVGATEVPRSVGVRVIWRLQ